MSEWGCVWYVCTITCMCVQVTQEVGGPKMREILQGFKEPLRQELERLNATIKSGKDERCPLDGNPPPAPWSEREPFYKDLLKKAQTLSVEDEEFTSLMNQLNQIHSTGEKTPLLTAFGCEVQEPRFYSEGQNRRKQQAMERCFLPSEEGSARQVAEVYGWETYAMKDFISHVSDGGVCVCVCCHVRVLSCLCVCRCYVCACVVMCVRVLSWVLRVLSCVGVCCHVCTVYFLVGK